MSLKIRGAPRSSRLRITDGIVAEHRGGAAVLIECVDAEARELRDLEREVGLQELFVVLALLVVHDVVNHTVHFLVLQRWHVDSLDVAVDADDRRHTRRQVQVRGVVLDGESEQLRYVYGGHDGPLIGARARANRAYHKAFHSIAKGTRQSVTEITEHLRISSSESRAHQRSLRARRASRSSRSASRRRARTSRKRFERANATSARATPRRRRRRWTQLRGLDITWHFIGALQANKTRDRRRTTFSGCTPSTARRSRRA